MKISMNLFHPKDRWWYGTLNSESSLGKIQVILSHPSWSNSCLAARNSECLPVHSMEAEKGHYKQSDELFLYQNKCIFTAL